MLPDGPRTALVGDALDGQVLRVAGWRVCGALELQPYDDPGDVPSYASMDELLTDGLDGVALSGGDAHLAGHLPDLVAAGLAVLLPTAAPLDLELLRLTRDLAPDALVAVGLVQRWEPWAQVTGRAAALAGGPVLQCTVRGWPRGQSHAAELIDLTRQWCGDVVGVAARPARLPADELAPGVPVAWSLLHESGATTLVSHEAAPPVVRLSFGTARWEAGPLGARWVGGAEVPLTAHRLPALLPPGTAPGLLSSAVWLREALTADDLPSPAPAGLGDLQAVARALAGLRGSTRDERAVEL
ncbi:MAG: oxidoreductase domain protein [Frankiales bacterium]|nr:oxidoreductase domain protein [Frankiales bacterium]